MQTDPESTPRGGGVMCRDVSGVVAPTVFTVGLMQGSTPRKAGCVRYRYACVIKAAGVMEHRALVWGVGALCMLTRFADANTACFPMYPAHAGYHLALSHGWKPVG